jgi:integron integrase
MSHSGKQESRFLERVRAATRVRHYSIRTERSYVGWIVRFIRFHNYRHPEEMREPQVAAFLNYLAVERNVAAPTQNQALNALLFLYKAVLDRPLGDMGGLVRAKHSEHLPVVLTTDEVRRILRRLDSVYWLPACLMYGSGLRLMETVRLRVKDFDFDHRAIVVREGKGRRDRVVTLPDELVVPLKRQLQAARFFHEKDLGDGYGRVYLPHALARKYPSAASKWSWQYAFPARRRSTRPATRLPCCAPARSPPRRWDAIL